MALLSALRCYKFKDHLATDVTGYEACAAYTRNPHVIVEQCRLLAKANQYSNEIIRLTLACLDGGVLSADRYISSNFQKFSRRQLKLSPDTTTVGGSRKQSRRHVITADRRKAAGESKVVVKSRADLGDTDDSSSSESIEDMDSGLPSTGTEERRKSRSNPEATDRDSSATTPRNHVIKVDPVALVHYAQICMGARSFQSAICERCVSSVSLDEEFNNWFYRLSAASL